MQGFSSSRKQAIHPKSEKILFFQTRAVYGLHPASDKQN
jgi:hypothetical protein